MTPPATKPLLYALLALASTMATSSSFLKASLKEYANHFTGCGTHTFGTQIYPIRNATHIRETQLYPFNNKLWDDRSISVCWEDTVEDWTRQTDWVRDAVETTWGGRDTAWKDRVDLRFSGWGQCSWYGSDGANIRIAVRDVNYPPHTLGLGTDLNNVTDGMVLNFSFKKYRPWHRKCKGDHEYCIRAYAIHEFGHALGFAHEMARIDTPKGCKWEEHGEGGNRITAWDPESVMNYCNKRWMNDGKLSDLDVIGFVRAYPAEDWHV
jgi:hypothetical protein